jgi:hypothetical protein
MRSYFLLPAIAFAAVIAAAPAFAQDAAADVRCLLVSNAFAGAEKDEGRKQLAILSAHFYLGRIDARLNPAQLKAQVVAVAKTLSPPTMAATMNSCAQRLREKQMVMQTIGKEITASAPAAPAK